MKRLMHIGLLLMALTGLIGQSTAMAMAPAFVVPAGNAPMAAMAGGNCMDMPAAPASGQSPCKKMTLQCIAAMGCSPLAFTNPYTWTATILRAGTPTSAAKRILPLADRTYGPEPDPPSILI